MPTIQVLADFEHPLVCDLARRLTDGEAGVRGKLARLFLFVRDEIKFGFPAHGDLLAASEVIRQGYGQCNNKGTVLLALCKAAGIPARIHFSLIGKEIQRGFFTGIAYALMPARISHSWLEVQVDQRWRRLDAYINDSGLQGHAVAELKRRGWRTGFSVALPKTGAPAIELDLDNEKFSQMAAVTDDHGTFDEPAAYYAGPHYRNRPGRLKLWLYRRMLKGINGRVQRLRSGELT